MTTTLNRWNPIRHMEDLQRNLLTALRPGVFYPLNGHAPEAAATSSWTPAMDVLENEKGYFITAELPGLRKEDITVMFQDDVVTVRGERKPLGSSEGDSQNQNHTWHVSERLYGTFERHITLPKDVDPSTLQAEMKDGVLSLRITKKQEALPRLIEVN